MNKYKAIIYDLDNTIFPARLISKKLVQPIFDAIIESNDGFYIEDILQNILADCYCFSIKDVAKKYKFPQHMLEAALNAFSKIEINYKLNTYSDYSCIFNLKGIRFLVTSGYSSFQESKIANLGIKKDFQEIYIHDNEESSFSGKLSIFRDIQRKYTLSNNEILVVGDNAASEIAAGNELKMTTIQILREGVIKTDLAKYHIQSFSELQKFNRL